MVRILKNTLEHRITSSSFSHGSQQMRMAMRTPGPPDRRSSTNFNQIGELQVLKNIMKQFLIY